MAKYTVRHNDLQVQADMLQKIGKTLAGFESKLISIANAMDGRDSSMATLKTQVRNCAKAVPVSVHKTNFAHAALKEAVSLYLTAEKQSYDSIAKLSPPAVTTLAVGAKVNLEDVDDDNAFLDWLWKSVGKAGFIGSTISFGKDIYDLLGGGGNLGKTVGKGTKAVWDYINDISGFNKGVSSIGKASEILTPESVRGVWADKLLGLGPIGTATTGRFFADWASRVGNFGDNFSKTLKNRLQDFVGGSTKSVGKAVTKWAGVALTGAVNFFDNKEEHGGVTWRGVGETVIETGVDVGLGLVVGAAVTALAPVSAPVLAVAAASTGVVMAADALVTKLTEKDIGENVSDAVFWVGEKAADGLSWVGNKIGEGAQAIGNGIKSAGDAIAGWFSKPLFSW